MIGELFYNLGCVVDFIVFFIKGSVNDFDFWMIIFGVCNDGLM